MKKKLLSEAQVRRFMGLAGLSRINENLYEEEPMEEPAGEEPAGEEPMEEPAEADVEIDEEDLADVAEALSTLQDKLAPLLDQAPADDMEEPMDEPAEEPEMDMGDEEPEGEEEMDMGGEEEEELDAELQEVNMELSEEEIVSEVARRVAKRIVEAKRAHKKMNEALGRKK
jgi:hypothetical protein